MKPPLYGTIPMERLRQFKTWSVCQFGILKNACDEQGNDVRDMPKVIEIWQKIQNEAKAELQTIEAQRQSLKLDLRRLLRRRNALNALIGKPY